MSDQSGKVDLESMLICFMFVPCKRDTSAMVVCYQIDPDTITARARDVILLLLRPLSGVERLNLNQSIFNYFQFFI
jgi:hypothetical protein